MQTCRRADVQARQKGILKPCAIYSVNGERVFLTIE